jgi:hypothetical protein
LVLHHPNGTGYKPRFQGGLALSSGSGDGKSGFRANLEGEIMTVEKNESTASKFLNATALNALTTAAFQQREPYPWINIPNILTSQGFEQLRTTLPEVSQFERRVAVKRAHGQGYHDRYILHYRAGVEVSPAWRQFVKEIQGKTYDGFIRRMFGVKPRGKLILTMEWYYGWQGCGVSPHCDARRKLGTHIFYFNTEADWKSEWGGEILLMDDQKKRKAHSAPEFDELRVAASLDPRGNDSLLFQRTEHSWHGVRPLQSPPNQLRKLFIVTINVPTWQVLFRRLRGKDPDGYRITKAA